MYISDNEMTNVDLANAVRRNLDNPYIAEVVTLSERLYKFDGIPYIGKLTQHLLDRRLTFQDAFQFANSYYPGRLVIISNADVYFDCSLARICKPISNQVDMTNRVFALGTWEQKLVISPKEQTTSSSSSSSSSSSASSSHYTTTSSPHTTTSSSSDSNSVTNSDSYSVTNSDSYSGGAGSSEVGAATGAGASMLLRTDSQDAWIFRSPMRSDVVLNTNFFIGAVRADNVLAGILTSLHYSVINPMFGVHAFESDRSSRGPFYGSKDSVLGPMMDVLVSDKMTDF